MRQIVTLGLDYVPFAAIVLEQQEGVGLVVVPGMEPVVGGAGVDHLLLGRAAVARAPFLQGTHAHVSCRKKVALLRDEQHDTMQLTELAQVREVGVHIQVLDYKLLNTVHGNKGT